MNSENDTGLKTCSICGENKPLNEYYMQKKKDGKIYYHPECKLCTGKRSHLWAIKNQKRMREIRIKHSKKEYVVKRDQESKRSYREKGGQTIWQRNNKERLDKYRKNHRNHNISNSEWIACKEYFNNSCAYCGLHIDKHYIMFRGKLKWTDLHKEHVQHDGKNDLSNCVPSCQSCNSQKRTRLFEFWYCDKNERYSIDRYNKILNWLHRDYKKYIE